MQDFGYYIGLTEYVITFMIMVTLVAIFKYRKNTYEARNWILTFTKVFLVFLLWCLLSFALIMVIIIHTAYYLEEKIFLINIFRTISYVAFCVLLIIIEVRSKPSNDRSVSKSLDVQNDEFE